MVYMVLLILLKLIKDILYSFGGIYLLWVKLEDGNIIIQEYRAQYL